MRHGKTNLQFRSGPGGAVGAFLLLLACLAPGPAQAQLLHLDPPVWSSAADTVTTGSFLVEMDRFEEPEFGWSADRLLLTLVLPTGRDGAYFVRMPYVVFDRKDVSLFARWPWLEGEQEDTRFRDERRVSSFGQLEVGMDRRREWPLLGPVQFAGSIGLPVGSDRLYPLSSVSFPLRAQLRRSLAVSRGVVLALGAGTLYNIDSGGSRLDSAAFPNGWQGNIALQIGTDRERRLVVDYRHEDRDGRRSALLGVACHVPWTAEGAWGLRVERQLAGTLDRYAAWRFCLSWRFDQLRPEGDDAKPVLP